MNAGLTAEEGDPRRRQGVCAAQEEAEEEEDQWSHGAAGGTLTAAGTRTRTRTLVGLQTESQLPLHHSARKRRRHPAGTRKHFRVLLTASGPIRTRGGSGSAFNPLTYKLTGSESKRLHVTLADHRLTPDAVKQPRPPHGP